MSKHLTPDELQELRTELQIELKRLGGRPARPDEDPAANVAAARAAGVPERLLRILEALSRMRTGHYGVCVACHGPIAFSRLLAIPETTTCSTCSGARAVAVR